MMNNGGKFLIGALMAISLLSGCNSEQQSAQVFKNTEFEYKTDLRNIWKILKEYISVERAAPVPIDALPIKPLSFAEIQAAKNNSAAKLGHSTILMKINEQLILLDPVFSERASPVQWAGPKRFHKSPISIDELEHIDVVVISHDHYDHLDKNSIKQLNNKVGHFIVPLNVGTYLQKWGVEPSKISELNWWQSTQVNGVEYIATPTQHFSGRGLTDRDETLWASWVIRTDDLNVYFSGDSGYFSGFAEIGEKYGPFDLTFVEAGAYNKLWADIHMLPEESVQAHIDLKGMVMTPIHNATFDLALHDWYEPLDRVEISAKQNGVTLATPVFGELFEMKSPKQSVSWWRQSN